MATSTAGLIQELVSGSTTFQGWVGASTAAAAIKRVYYPAVPGWDETGADLDHGPNRPFALVEKVHREWDSLHGAYPNGTADLTFESEVISQNVDDHPAAMAAFESTVTDIIADMMALGRTGGYLMVRSIAELEQAQREEMHNTEDPHITQRFMIEWGLG